VKQEAFDVAILGAGAAGLMAAWQAAGRGRKVVVLDHNDRPGRKILISGGGRCNFTNREVGFENFVSHNPRFAISALSRFTPHDFIALLQQAHIPFHERELGQLFCDRSAADIADLLADHARQAGAEFRFKVEVKGVDREGEGFSAATNHGPLHAKAVVVATGGLSVPKVGAGDVGLRIARHFGLKVVPPRPALVPLTWGARDLKHFGVLAGIALPVATHSGASPVFSSNLLFTHKGISGPAILQVSSYWQPGQGVTVDWLPGVDLFETLKTAKKGRPKAQLRTVLGQWLPKRLIQALGDKGLPDGLMGQQTDAELEETALRLKGWVLHPEGSEGYRVAEATAGGVDTGELSSKTMEARQVPGLYFVGEVIDITGWLGGYNLQWAWSSGWVAGQVA